LTTVARPEHGFEAAARGAAFLRDAPYVCLSARGADALDLLHRLSTNDLRQLHKGQVARTILTSEKGRMIDLVTVAVLDDGLLLLVSRGNEENFRRWIEKFTITEDITLAVSGTDVEVSCLIGPGALEKAATLAGKSVPPGVAARSKDRSNETTIMSTGARWGQEILFVSENRTRGNILEDRCRDAGAAVIDASDFECARIARARPAFGFEITEAFTPHDAGLGEFISTTKGCYVGQEVIARMMTYQKIRKGLIGFTSAAALPKAGDRPQLFKDETEIGVLTSASPHQVHGRSLGLGIVRMDQVSVGDTLSVGEPESNLTCRVVPLPMEFTSA
jgi:folate-binding protein YgfZ